MAVIPKASLEVPLEFENLRDALITLFKANEQDLYTTIDHQEQSRSSELMKGDLRTIQVFFQSGDPEGASMPEFEEEVTFGLYLRASEPSTGDKATLESKTATPAEKQAALIAIDTGSARADLSWDELLRIAIRIVMSPLNEPLGLEPVPTDNGLLRYRVTNRKLKTYRKDQTIDHGRLVTVTGSAFITASVTEIMDGATPVAGGDPILKAKENFKTVDDPTDADPALLQTNIENP